MKTFDLPATPTCRVVYIKDGVTYAGVIQTPSDNHQLQAVMLGRKVGMSQVERVEPIQPVKEIQRGHPAQHRIAEYMSYRD